VDQDGRVFGRFNLFDAVIGAMLLAMVALSAVGYRLLRAPLAPTIATVTPATLKVGPDLRVVVKGENLLPYMRVFVQRTSKPAAVMHDIDPGSHFDNYVLANGAQARFLVESTELAEVRLPDGLLPGAYDLVLYNEANIVAVRQAAFTVFEVPREVTVATVSLRFIGRPEILALVREQDVDVSPGEDRDGKATITAIGRRVEMTGELTENLFDGNVRGPQRVGVLDCTVRMPVVKIPSGWWYRAQAIKAGAGLVFQTDQYVVRGTIVSVPQFEHTSSIQAGKN
jgi:hypothetical protein